GNKADNAPAKIDYPIAPSRRRGCTIGGATIANARQGEGSTMPWNKQHSAVANSFCAVVGIAHAPVHRHRKLARCVGFAALAACAGVSWAGGYTSAGIYPGDPDANAIKLPGDFEAVI